MRIHPLLLSLICAIYLVTHYSEIKSGWRVILHDFGIKQMEVIE